MKTSIVEFSNVQDTPLEIMGKLEKAVIDVQFIDILPMSKVRGFWYQRYLRVNTSYRISSIR